MSAIIATPKAAYSVDVGGIVGELMRGAIEAQRQQAIRDQQRREFEGQQHAEQMERDRQQRAILLEQRRSEAEFRAQQQIDRNRKEAQLRVEEDAQRARQAEIDRRDAVARLTPAAKQLIDDASSFLRANPSNPKVLEYAEQINALNDAVSQGNLDKLQALTQALAANLRREPGYETWENKKGEAIREQANRELPALIRIARQYQAFLRFYVTNNPTARPTVRFIALLKDLERDLVTPELTKLKTLTGNAEMAIREAGLADDFAKSKGVLVDRSQPADASSDSPWRRTSKNSFLVDGDARDFVLLYNSSPGLHPVSLTPA